MIFHIGNTLSPLYMELFENSLEYYIDGRKTIGLISAKDLPSIVTIVITLTSYAISSYLAQVLSLYLLYAINISRL